MNQYISCWRNYATFSGRAPAGQYWIFTLVNLLVTLGLALPLMFATLNALAAQQPMPQGGLLVYLSWAGNVFTLAQILPSLGVLVRRLHDTDHSGWWYWIVLIPIVGWIITLIWLCQRGTQGENRFGPDPMAAPLSPAQGSG